MSPISINCPWCKKHVALLWLAFHAGGPFENSRQTSFSEPVLYTSKNELLKTTAQPKISAFHDLIYLVLHFPIFDKTTDISKKKEIDFVYIDGPTTNAPSDGHKTFDFDFVRVVERSEKPVFALVDTRMSTCWALSHLIKEGKVLFDYLYEVGLVGPCTKNDLRTDWNGLTKGLGPRPIKGGNVQTILSKKD